MIKNLGMIFILLMGTAACAPKVEIRPNLAELLPEEIAWETIHRTLALDTRRWSQKAVFNESTNSFRCTRSRWGRGSPQDTISLENTQIGYAYMDLGATTSVYLIYPADRGEDPTMCSLMLISSFSNQQLEKLFIAFVSLGAGFKGFAY